MKIELINEDLNPKIITETVVSIEKERKLLYSERKIQGLTFWQKNLATGEISKAPLEPVFKPAKTIMLHGFMPLRSDSKFDYELKKQDGFAYCQALNKENATKKFNKL